MRYRYQVIRWPTPGLGKPPEGALDQILNNLGQAGYKLAGTVPVWGSHNMVDLILMREDDINY